MKKFGRKLAYLMVAGALLLSSGGVPQGLNTVYAKDIQDYGEDTSTDDDFEVDGTTLKKYKGTSKVVDLTKHDATKNITKIDQWAFKDWDGLETIIIPKSVETIEKQAFGGLSQGSCENLSTVIFEEGSQLNKIGEEAFYKCKALEEIELPESCKTIGKSAFCSCEALEEIEIPESCKNILGNAFRSCENLMKVTFKGNPVIGEDAFEYTSDELVFYSATEASNVEKYAKDNGIRYNRLISELNAVVDPTKLVCFVGDELNSEDIAKAVTITATPTNSDYTISVSAVDCEITVDGIEKDYWGNFTLNTATRTQKITFEYNEKSTSIEIPVYYRLTNEEDSQVSITVNGNFTYTGEEIKPEVIVKTTDKNRFTLEKDTDYTVEYSNNTDAGTATVTITGKDDTSIYKGTQTEEFYISPKDIDVKGNKDKTGKDISVTFNPEKPVYDKGQEVKPKVTVSYGDGDGKITLTEGTDYEVSYTDNIDVNTDESQVLIETLDTSDNFTGSTTRTFGIVPLSIKDDSTGTNVEVGNQTYTGKAIIPNPQVTVTDSSNPAKTIELEKDKDYTVTCSNNVAVGKADMTITGKGNYKDSIEIDEAFEIVPAPISSAGIEDMETPYTGSAVTPAVQASLNGLQLTEGTDYTVEITGGDLTEVDDPEGEGTKKVAINSGIYTLTLTGKGNFEGTVEKTMRIKGTSVENAKIDVQDAQYTVEDDGKKYTPDVTVTVGSKILDKDKDYKVEYSNNEKPGQAKVTVKGIGAYEGEKDAQFKVLPIQLFGNEDEEKNAVISVPDVSYDVETPDKQYTPEVTVSLGNRTLKKDEDYTVKYENNTKPGEGKVTVEGMGVYAGKGETSFAISWLTLFSDNEEESAKVSAIAEQVYTGDEIKPSVTVTLADKELKEGQDYKVIYGNNTNVGTATAKVVGAGNYISGGEKTIEFNIVAASIANAKVNVNDVKYADADKDGKCMPKPVVTVGERQLEEGVDYSLTYSYNDKPGDGTVTVTGIGNYKDDVSATFKIIGQSLFGDDTSSIGGNGSGEQGGSAGGNGSGSGEQGGSTGGNGNGSGEQGGSTGDSGNTSNKGAIVAAISDYTFTGSEIKPSIKLTMDGSELKEGIDYEISYINNVNVGKATATIKGIGKFAYGGEKNVDFNILPASIESAEIAAISDQQATGSAITPDVTVTLNEKALKNDDYTVTYADNVNAGTATVTIEGKGNYTGKKTASFVIKAAASSTGDQKPSGSQSQPSTPAPTPTQTTTPQQTTTVTQQQPAQTTTTPVTPTTTTDEKVTAPKKVTIKSVVNKASKKAVLKWKKVSGVKGYEVYIATKKNFKKGKKVKNTSKTTYTFTKLKTGTTYYVCVRAYKTNNGEKVYGKYSKVKKIKITK